MKYCKRCVIPDTKPDLTLDEEGLCSACRTAEKKHKEIDWEAREKELRAILEKYRSKDGTNYDCIIPVSGGKDSTYQTHVITEKYGLNPLCVTFDACKSTELGKRNLRNLKEMGVDHIHFTPNKKVYRRLFKVGLEKVGDPCLPCHIGIFTYPVNAAVKYRIPLLIWGENPQMEYGGPAGISSQSYLDRGWLDKWGGLLGLGVEELKKEGFSLSELLPYDYPSDEEIGEVGVTGLFLGYYLKWDARKQLEIVKKLGFQVHDGPERGTYTNYENLDCGFTGIHDFFKYIKYGFGRATDHACTDIRNERLTREEAVRLVRKYDGNYSNEECQKELHDFLNFVGVSETEFWNIVDRFRGKEVWEKNENGEWVRKSQVR